MSLLKHWSCHLVLTLTAFIGAESDDEYYLTRWSRCFYSSHDLSDMVFIDDIYFNKQLIVQFNSTVGSFEGFNEYGTSVAEGWNNGPFLITERTYIDTECRFNVKKREKALHDKAVKPKVKLSLVKQSGGSYPAMLICSAYEFYPQHIKVSWLRDGEVMTSEMTSVMELADGDWYYQVHSEMAYIPRSGEKISCMVEHASSTQPIITNWDPSLPDSEKIKIGIGSSVLVLGVITAAAGLIYYKKSMGQWK
ncbi:H-2 class II histocompatibility antigen, E-S beta chain-like isoform X1 [Ctenopharyngodon idella]|uniref:H-2 class II histocompatibility antigen, E-S beta chain-like isoform X1 n=1 Tax=Ctenopharyngodon idella TaxID=7959 RepID=UPI002231CE33|nr:H-2 class II histocompatibility antigen, E-S beta chain-like isoform X1 [Ctenopharyngodon idella]